MTIVRAPPGTPALPAPDSGDDEPPDESPFEKFYVAVDGVSYDDFSQAEREQLQQRLIEYFLLETGHPITNVRVIDGKKRGVIEYDAPVDE